MRGAKFLLVGAAALGMVGIMSLLPPETKFALHTQGVLHPWFHLAAFGIVAFLLIFGIPSAKLRTVILLAVILFGLGTEMAEHYINGTVLESSDIFADTVGAVLGCLAALLINE